MRIKIESYSLLIASRGSCDYRDRNCAAKIFLNNYFSICRRLVELLVAPNNLIYDSSSTFTMNWSLKTHVLWLKHLDLMHISFLCPAPFDTSPSFIFIIIPSLVRNHLFHIASAHVPIRTKHEIGWEGFLNKWDLIIIRGFSENEKKVYSIITKI